MKLWYISFCDEHFLGGLHIWASSFAEACLKASLIGENPGGEALGRTIPSEIAKRIPERYTNRLLTEEELGEAVRIIFADDPSAAELIRVDSNGRPVG